MRESFPSATLITSRASAHGFNAARDFLQNHRCLRHLRKYLEDGIIETVDGQVCAVRTLVAPLSFSGDVAAFSDFCCLLQASDMVDTCTLVDIVSGQAC